MHVRDLLNVNVVDLAPEASEFEIDGLGKVVVRKATLRDEIKFKKRYGDRLERLQEASMKGDMVTVCEALWDLFDHATREKIRSVKFVDDNGESLTIKDLDNEYEALLFFSAGSFEKSLFTGALGKAFAGEKALEEIPDEELKKKLIAALRPES